jgi:hypothetical protein
MLFSDVTILIAPSVIANEYENIKSRLNKFLPTPVWAEQVTMEHYLTTHVKGARFTFDKDRWGYVEEGL